VTERCHDLKYFDLWHPVVATVFMANDTPHASSGAPSGLKSLPYATMAPACDI